jgi:DNA polymerase I-like protein with 3'-5' exonuclease and polymerase domains
MIRGLFLPEEGEVWGSFDYSSQEPRIVVHYAYRLMPKPDFQPSHKYSFNQADTFVQNYLKDPRSDFHQIAADIVGVPRKQAKTINLGLFYGMGVNKLAEQLGLDYDSGRALFKEYHSKVPFVKDLIDYATEQADKNGSIRTLLGRLGRFDKFEPRSFGIHKPLTIDEARKEYGEHIPLKRAFVFKALNKLIQGSAADQTKKAMVDLYDAGILPMIQIHDELAVSIKDKAMAHQVVEIMEKCVEMYVPSVVDAELGRTWGEAALPIEEDSLWLDPANE